MLKTKRGIAKINKKGYYRITRPTEKQYLDKSLHRLIFEEFYKIKLPSNIFIHHVDGDKTNNKIWNLIPMTDAEHTKHHSTNRTIPEATRKKISESIGTLRNASGCFRVSKQVNKEVNQGYFWKYRYMENGKRKSLSSVDLNKLKEKVLDNGLEWKVLNDELAEQNGLILTKSEELFELPIIHIECGLWSYVTWV